MKQWWHHHESELPIFEDEEDMAVLEELTGRIPLLLRPLLSHAGKPLHEVMDSILEDQDIARIGINIRYFTATIMQESAPSYER
jgi:hypothetical protein